MAMKRANSQSERMCDHDRIAETIVIDLQKPRTERAIKTDPAELAFEASEAS